MSKQARDEPDTRDREEANSTESDACWMRSVCGVDVTRCLDSAVCACWLAIQRRSVIAVVRVASCKCSVAAGRERETEYHVVTSELWLENLQEVDHRAGLCVVRRIILKRNRLIIAPVAGSSERCNKYWSVL